MIKILFGSLVVMTFITFTGCSGADANSTSDVNSSKSSKCGEDKKSTKCGTDKKAEDAMKCGEGKCGGDKK
jgi:uncharacterized low-complexity protein